MGLPLMPSPFGFNPACAADQVLCEVINFLDLSVVSPVAQVKCDWDPFYHDVEASVLKACTIGEFLKEVHFDNWFLKPECCLLQVELH